MTKQFTKEDYQVVLDRIYQLDGMTFSDHQKTDANYAECLARYSDEILSALKIAIAAQPRPIEEVEEYYINKGGRIRPVMSDCGKYFYDLSFLPKPQERND